MSVRGSWTDSPAAGLQLPGARARAGSASAAGWLGLAGLLGAGIVVSLGAAHTAALLPESIRPAPPWLSGAFGAVRLDLHVGGAAAALLVMFAGYVLVVGRAERIDVRALVAGIVALNVLMLLAAPLVSTDVFSYQAYARMGAHYGLNPYLNGPYAVRLDRVFPYVGAKWSSIPSAYGPLFTAGSYLLATLTVASSVVVYKSIAAAASLGLVAMVWRCAQLRGVDPARAIALVGLNPLLVVYGVGGGHNDLLMLAALAGSLWMLARRPAAGGALSLVAVAVKLTGGLVLPFALADGGRARGLAGRRRLLLGAAVACGLLGALSVAFFGSGVLHMFATVSRAQSEGDWLSISGAIGERLGLPTLGLVIGDLLLGGFVLVCLGLLVGVWRGAIDWIDAAGWATLAMLIASSALLPWYVAWVLPLAALARSPRLRTAALVMTGLVQVVELLGTIPHQ